MSKIDQLVKTIVKAIDEKDRKKTQALDTVATVSRIDGDTAWVKFAGSDSETPVKQTIAVKKGDKVQVRASKGNAWITGNITSPPTDNTLAEEAVKKSDTATKRAKRAEDMSIVADVMYYLASDQDEGVTTEDEGWTQEPQEATVALPYLWCYHEYTRGNGSKFNSEPVIIGHYTEGGAGITAVQPQYYLSTSSTSCTGGSWGSSFTYLSGYYIWTREQITLSDSTITYSTPIYSEALTDTCRLSNDTAQYFWTKTGTVDTTNIPTGSYVTMYPKSEYTNSGSANYCKGGSTLIRSDGLYLRYGAQTVAQFLAAGVTLLNSAGATLAEFLSSGLTIYNGSGTEIAHLGYGSTSDSGTTTQSPYYTLGKRKSGSTIGAYSLGVGSNATASGSGSLAIGKDCIAESTGKLAIGYYNSNTSTNAFEVGNGGSTSNRKTSFAVSYTGNINADGSATIGGSISASGNASITGSLSANSVTIGGHSNAIGYTTEASSTSDLATTTSWANITGAYVSLGAGTWVIEGMASITSASSSTSTPNPNVGVRINGSSAYAKGAQIVPALGAGQVIAVAIATVSSGTQTFYVQAKKSGGSVVVGGGIKAVRIA